jgi:TPR repeat protein
MSLSFLFQWFGQQKRLAAETFTGCASSGDAEAQFQLGLKLASGQGDAQNYPEAAQWYVKAAAQNHALAQFNLAMMYAQGQGVPRDEARSLAWLTRSAELGDAGAQYRLGIQQHRACQGQPSGRTATTRVEALKWVKLSAAQGYRGADSACEFVALEMTREEVAESGRRTAAFQAEKPPGGEATPT